MRKRIKHNIMAKDKEFSTVFRDRFRGFEEQPSGATWKRLERRLETHQRRNRRSLSRSLTMVAAVMLLAVFAFLFSTVGLTGDGPLSSTSRDAQLEMTPLSEEQLNPEAYQVFEFTLKYRDRMSNVVEEGEADRELLVRKK
jgi:hypothetical protein